MDNRKNLTERDFKILMALEENPLANFEELAEMTGFPKSSVFNIYESLSKEKKGYIPIFTISALPNLLNLELKIIDVLIDAPKRSQYLYLREMCLEHPYTVYEARIYGSTNGMLIQFRIPDGTQSLIRKLFQEIASRGKLQSFKILSFPIDFVYTRTLLKNWNHSSLTWDFNWNSWFNSNDFSRNTDDKNSLLCLDDSSYSPTTLKWLKKTDICIINELVKNSRRKIVDYLNILKEEKNLHFTRQTLSRRLKKILKECIIGHRLLLKSHSFNLYSPILLIGKSNITFIKNLTYRLKYHRIPFTSTYKHSKNTFFWYINIPSSQLSDLLYELGPYLSNLELNVIDYTRSRIFHLYKNAFDEKKNQWIKSKDFMVNDVIAYLDNWEKNHN